MNSLRIFAMIANTWALYELWMLRKVTNKDGSWKRENR